MKSKSQARSAPAPSTSVEVQIELSRVAVGIYSEIYRGDRLASYEPQRKTAIHDAWHGKKLSERHSRAWAMTVRLFTEADGQSVGNGGYGDPKGGGSTPALRGWMNVSQERKDHLREFFLHHHEWLLLNALVRDCIQTGARGERLLHLDRIGLQLSGYRDKAQARAAGVASVHRLLDSLAEYHGL